MTAGYDPSNPVASGTPIRTIVRDTRTDPATIRSDSVHFLHA